ncbi:phage tail protein [Mucilaginibacter lacusdianchii]|uniref:phage tail protein n=1 Tax=Mucilaginibacter lacusdianchii TaxID=2684211 RepID=UPI00131B1943|nr:tail fiber protein [Mucilaginibacter sp. JXJ CY 39]
MEGTVAEIRMFGATFAPESWAFCQGQTMNINTNQALYALIGTVFGGNGIQTFNLPDMQGRVPVGIGTIPNQQFTVTLGQKLGAENVMLTSANLPPHTHQVTGAGVCNIAGNLNAKMTVNSNPSPNSQANPNEAFLSPAGGNKPYATTNNGTLNVNALQVSGANMSVNPSSMMLLPVGGSAKVDLHMPSLAVNFIICVNGTFPARN